MTVLIAGWSKVCKLIEFANGYVYAEVIAVFLCKYSPGILNYIGGSNNVNCLLFRCETTLIILERCTQ